MMAGLFVVALLTTTSVIAYGVGRRRPGFRIRELPDALADMLESVGVVLAFYLANVILGLAVLIAMRSLSRQFLSVYVVADPTLLVISLFQALVFHSWGRRCRAPTSQRGAQG